MPSFIPRVRSMYSPATIMMKLSRKPKPMKGRELWYASCRNSPGVGLSERDCRESTWTMSSQSTEQWACLSGNLFQLLEEYSSFFNTESLNELDSLSFREIGTWKVINEVGKVEKGWKSIFPRLQQPSCRTNQDNRKGIARLGPIGNKNFEKYPKQKLPWLSIRYPLGKFNKSGTASTCKIISGWGFYTFYKLNPLLQD